jgi:hypothetical protein
LGIRAAKKQPEIPAAKLDPLYLLYCGVEWHRSAQTESGWELVQAMLSEDRGGALLPPNFWPGPKTDACLSAIYGGP